MPKHKRYCPDCGSLMDIRGECECHHPRAICPLFRGLTKTMGNHFYFVRTAGRCGDSGAGIRQHAGAK